MNAVRNEAAHWLLDEPDFRPLGSMLEFVEMVARLEAGRAGRGATDPS